MPRVRHGALPKGSTGQQGSRLGKSLTREVYTALLSQAEQATENALTESKLSFGNKSRPAKRWRMAIRKLTW